MWSQLQTEALWLYFNESLFDTFLEDPQQIWVEEKKKNEGGGSD